MKTNPKYFRLYLISFGILIVDFVWLMYARKPDLIFYLLAWIGLSLFATGFVYWVLPTLKYIWVRPIGKTVVALFHAFLLVFALGPALDLVAGSTGLPPQDFTVSVAFWGVFLYPFMWIGALSIVLLVLYLSLFLASSVVWVTTLIGINDVILYFAKFLPESSPSQRFIQTGRHSFINTFFLHAFGALVLAMIMVALNTKIWEQTWRLKPAARVFAAISDYHIISSYPGIDEKRPALIHENGLVSYAEPTGPWTVDFTVERVAEVEESRQNFPQP